jgi:hypothetical protein
MPPFRVTEPTPGGWPSGTPSTRAGCFPTSAFVPAALSRGFLHIRRRTVDIPRFSARPSSPRPRGRVLPRHFRRVRSVTSRISGIVGIVTNVPVHDSPSVCPCPHAPKHFDSIMQQHEQPYQARTGVSPSMLNFSKKLGFKGCNS